MGLKAKLAELLVDITTRLDPLRSSLAKARALLKRGMATMTRLVKRGAMALGVALAAALVWSTKAAMEQEEAETALAAALALTGDATEENIASFKEYAAEIQKSTTYGDEFTLNLMAQLKALGVHTSQLQEAAKTTIGLMKATGRGAETMTMATAALMAGDTALLTRYIPALRGTTLRTEKLRLATKLATDGFKLAEAAAHTTRGRLKQLWNTIGDVAEKIGVRLLPHIEKAAIKIKEWTVANEELITAEFGKWLDRAGTALKIIAEQLTKIVKHWKIVISTIAVAGVFSVVLKIVTGIAAVFHTINIYAMSMGLTFEAAAAALGVIAAKVALYPAIITGLAALVVTKIKLIFAELRLLKAWYDRWQWKDPDSKRSVAFRKALKADADAYKKAAADERKSETGKQEAIKARIDLLKKARAVEEAAKEAEKETAAQRAKALDARREELEVLRAYYEKVGGYEKALDNTRKELRVLETIEITRVTELKDMGVLEKLNDTAIALAKEEAEEKKKLARAEKRTKLQILKDLFTDAVGRKKDLAVVDSILRAKEAREIARHGDITYKKAKAILDLKEEERNAKLARAEKRTRFQILKDLFTDAVGKKRKLAKVDEKLRHLAAKDLARQTGIKYKEAKAILDLKAEPVARAEKGLVDFAAAWGQIATGTKRIEEQQLKVQQKMEGHLKQIAEKPSTEGNGGYGS